MPTLNQIIAVVFAGVLAASLYAFAQKRLPGDLVRALLEKGADRAEKAVAISELDRKYSRVRVRFLERALKTDPALRKYVKTAEGDGEARYYVPEELCKTAAHRYDKKGAGLLVVLLCALICLLAALISMWIAPYLKNMAQNVPESFHVSQEAVGTVTESTVLTPADEAAPETGE